MPERVTRRDQRSVASAKKGTLFLFYPLLNVPFSLFRLRASIKAYTALVWRIPGLSSSDAKGGEDRGYVTFLGIIASF